jgi:hypothetical protein
MALPSPLPCFLDLGTKRNRAQPALSDIFCKMTLVSPGLGIPELNFMRAGTNKMKEGAVFVHFIAFSFMASIKPSFTSLSLSYKQDSNSTYQFDAPCNRHRRSLRAHKTH